MNIRDEDDVSPLAPLPNTAAEQIEYYTIASYKMSSSGIAQTLHQSNSLHHQHSFYHQQLHSQSNVHQRRKSELMSINELSRTSSNSTTVSLSSDIYLDPDHDYKVELKFTTDEIDLIRTTWKEMISDDLNKSDKSSSIASSLFCIQFYSNLLSMDKNLEKLFPSIKHQAVSFAGVLSSAILSLDNLEALDDYLSNLGKRHARILGIDPPHFELMGIALMKTFKDRFGENFTLELERCWARLYTYLANSILQFGIDPVIKNGKVNDEFNFITRSTTANSTSSTQASSIFEGNNRCMSYSSTVTGAPSLLSQQRNGSVSSATQRMIKSNATLPPLPAGASIPTSTAATTTKTKSKMSKTLSKSRENEDEKCVIM